MAPTRAASTRTITASRKAAVNKETTEKAPTKTVAKAPAKRTAAKKKPDDDEAPPKAPAKRTASKKKADGDEDEPKAKAPARSTASRKRKAEEEVEEEEDEDDSEETEEEEPTSKRIKTAAGKKAPVKKAAAPKAKTEKAAPATTTTTVRPKRAAKSASPQPEPEKTKKVAPKKVAAPKKAPAPKKEADKPVKAVPSLDLPALRARINQVPTEKFDVYVFGEGGSGELGLGSRIIDGKKPIDVKRPRHNAKLAADSVGVVQIACGGMHSIALTADNKILTWGVNDQGALGRDTTWNSDGADDDDDDEEESGLNPLESMPTAVSDEYFATTTKFCMVAASDSASFALTEDGFVYGWGTFRASEGILGFSDSVKIQARPAWIRSLKSIKTIAAGSNHILAMDKNGVVVAWGCGQQNQLGRRVIERFKTAGLTPTAVGLPRNKIVKIACGSYHSFAVDKDGKVYAWGLNNFGMTGVVDNAGEDEAVVLRPTIVDALSEYRIADIAGGEHHSVACTTDGELLTWGRSDGAQTGVPKSKLTEENAVVDDAGNPRILIRPAILPEVTNAVHVAAGTDNSFAITRDGKAYSWGFSENYQTGQGATDDVPVPTLIDNTAVRGKHLTFAGAGGQFSILAGPAV